MWNLIPSLLSTPPTTTFNLDQAAVGPMKSPHPRKTLPFSSSKVETRRRNIRHPGGSRSVSWCCINREDQ